MRFRFRYSLRIFLLVWLVIGLGLGWFGIRLRQANRQAAAVAGLVGEVEYDYHSPYEAQLAAQREKEFQEFQKTGVIPGPPIYEDPAPSEPAWLINLLGVDFFHDVVGYRYLDPSQILELHGPNLSDPPVIVDLRKELDSLAAMPYLTEVSIAGISSPSDREIIQSQLFAKLGRLRYLTDLTLAGFPANNKQLAHLRDHSELRRLNFTNVDVTDEAIDAFGMLPKLEELNLNHCGQVGKSGLEIIGHWRSLRKVNLRDTACDDRALAVLATLPAVESLDLAFTRITPAGLKQLGNMKSLRELWLDGLKLGPAESLQVLSQLPLLERLYLRNAENLQAEKLKGLQDIIPLKYLDLAEVDTTDEDLAVGLQGWQALEGLNLSYSKAGPKFASQIATLRALRTLDLSRTPIAKDNVLQKELVTPNNCRVELDAFHLPSFNDPPTTRGRF